MCPALRELFKEEIDEKVNAVVSAALSEAVSAAVSEAVSENTTTSIKSLMDTMNWTAEEAMDALKVPNENRVIFLGRLE